MGYISYALEEIKRKFVMEKQRHFVSSALVLLVIAFLSEVLVEAQDQSGFISIDCGLPANSTYVDPITGINYVSDEAFIDTGVSREIQNKNAYDVRNQQMWHLRSFPKGKRNCYTINVKKDQKYLIRALFYYGNYDNKNISPEFDLYLGVSLWVSIFDFYGFGFELSFYREIIHVVLTNRLRVCLVNKGKGAPYISAIELRPLPSNIYDNLALPDDSLLTLHRGDVGSLGDAVRYNNGDIYDRIWEPFYPWNSENVNTTMPVNSDASEQNNYSVPSTVMMTAVTAEGRGQTLQYEYPNTYTNNSIHSVTLYIYLYFAEVQKLLPNQSRSFTLTLPKSYDEVTPTYLTTTMRTFTDFYPALKEPEVHTINFTSDKSSSLPPLINAIEFFEGITTLSSQTQEVDVDAMMSIKSVYNVTTRNWQGDPCAPEAFKWDGIKCTEDEANAFSITYLNLSSSDLTGNISSYISNLTELQVLDLSYNYLTGSVPDFLADMKFLKFIDLRRNNLTGSVPTKLREKSERTLTLRLDGNRYLCKQEVCNVIIKTKKKNLSPIVGGVAAVSLLIIIFATMAICWHLRLRRYRKLGPLEANGNSRRIRYSEIVTATDNLKTIIGEGGFGKVYLGQIGGKEVAVKMLSASSCQGQKEFQAEAELLMRVHHTNLISLIGYCDEENHLCLVYEYMSLGNLGMHLSETKENTLTWEQRLQIATDAAQGLDYLHRGCKPPMIHRDVKSSNILISEKFNGKVADFGLSRASPLAGGHETTVVAGTPGYLDPEYFKTNKLNEKSDVYSFGIVLMEIVTCRRIISKEGHIIQYVNKMISTGNISGIIDSRLKGDVDVNSVWRVLELATTCVAQDSTHRPNMNHVAMELEECLVSIRNPGGEMDSSVEMTSSNFSTDSGPEAR